MIAWMLLTMAANATTEPLAESPSPPRHFLNGATRPGCETPAVAGEVVVCGQKDTDAQYRLRPVEDARFEERPVQAKTRIFGSGSLQAHGTQANVGGFSAPRAQVTLSFPF